MNRRELFKYIAAGGMVVAGELWMPGQKLISIPNQVRYGEKAMEILLCYHNSIVGQWTEMMDKSTNYLGNEAWNPRADPVKTFGKSVLFDEIKVRVPASVNGIQQDLSIHRENINISKRDTLTIQVPEKGLVSIIA